MKKPGTIIHTPPSDYESWGSYTKENGWSDKVYSGKAIREWIQNKFRKTNLYGPYENLDEVFDEIDEEYREVGLTVGIYSEDHTELYEYWFQYVNGELDLVEKTIPLNLKQVKLTISSPLYINDGYLVTLSYAGIGRIIGGQVLFYRDNAPIGNLQAYTTDGGKYIINSETIGTHEYKVVITDSIGNKTEDSKLINVGIIQIIEDITLNLIRSLSKITLSTIGSLGNSFKISIKKLTDESNINVVIVDSENNILYTFIGLDNTFKEFIIDLSELDIEGKELFIKAFRGNEEVYSRELFRVLSSSTLFVSLQGNKIPTFVLGVPQSVYFVFESGADSLTINEGTNNEYFSWTYSTPISFDETGKALISIRLTPLKISTNGSIIYFNYGENKSVSLNLGNIEEKYETARSIEWNFNLLNNLNINSCFIDFTSEFLYPTDEEFLIKFNDKMWITNDVIHVNNIEIATPLYEDEPVYIGLGYGISDENINLSRPDPNFVYDCICINGTIVRISKNESFSRDTLKNWNTESNNDKNLNIKSIRGSKCRGILYRTNFEGKLNLIDNNTFIFESNYKEDFELEEENNNIATLTLKALGTYGNLDNKWDKSDFRNIKFGTIEDGFSKYVENSFETWHSNPEITPILFKISTSLKEKKKVLKKWGVVCSYTYTSPGKATKTGTVIVYSQGTSTLQYPIPNLRLNFQNNDNFELRENLSENYLTAKADYMESAHLNNTPLAMLYNRVMKSNLILEKSPAILNNLYDAIEGIPVIIKIQDIGSSEINLGSFMLNTDKNSNSMGFEINGYSDCMSLEGHSNELFETSARFNYGYDTNGDSLTEESLYTNGSLDLSKVITFLKKGLEERYLGPDSEDEYWMRFYNDYWKKIELGENIEDIVSIDYCCVYIIFLMVFAMSDNVGKNCMFDIWKDSSGNWGKMFPRFYDLDSSCGLTNGGLLDVLPFALVDKGWIPESIREKTHNSFGNSEFGYKYIKPQEMYLYSSNDSKLWNYIFNTYRDTRIATMYSNLRDSFLSYDYLINFFKEIIIDVIPVSQYNLDFLNKYLRTNYQHFMYGNRWTNFKDWLRARLSFCDSLFKYKNNVIKVKSAVTVLPEYMFPSYICVTTAGQTENWDFGYKPLASGGGNIVDILVSLSDYIVKNIRMFDTSVYDSWTLNTHPYEFNNLLSLTLGGGILPDLSKCINLKELLLTNTCSITDTDINVPLSVKKLSRVAYADEHFTPSSIIINIPDNSSLEEIELHYINITEVLDLATKCPNLKVLKLYNCNINQLIFPNSTISFTAEECTFNNITVNSETTLTSLELNNLTIETFNLAGTILRFDLFNSTIPTELHLESVEGIESLNLIKSNVKKVIVGNKTFANTLKLGLLESELEVFKKNTDSGDIINLDIFLNINVTSILNYKDKGTPIIQPINTLKYISGQYKGSSELDALDSSLYLLQYSGLSFGNTKIKKVVCSRSNPSLINGTAMFALCSELTEISCTNSTTFSSDWIFYDCPELTTLTNVKINKFRGAFVGDSIAYSKIKDTIDNKATNADFSYFMCLYLKSGETIVINEGDYPTLYGVYKMFNKPNDLELTRKNGKFAQITINAQFKLANSCTDISHMFCGRSDSLTKIVVNTSGENIFNDYSKITKAEGTFYGCSVSNINLLNKLTNVTNVNSMYAYSTITNQTFVNDKITLTGTLISDLHALFYYATFNNVGTIIIDDFIKNITIGVIDLDNCFFNCLSNSRYPIVKINNTLEISNTTTEVYINGIIGVSSLSNSDVFTEVVWNNKLKLRGTSSKGPRATPITSTPALGPFTRRRTTTSSITLGSSLKKNLNFYCYLYGVVGPNEGLTISIKYPGNISYICCGASNIKVSDITSQLTFDAKGAFRQCNFKDSTTNYLPSNILNNVKNADEMFAGSNLYKITFNLSDTITSVKSMFNLCYQLRNGLPTHFYDNATTITDFTRIFYGTSIVVVPHEYDGLSNFLPSQTIIADGAFACIKTSTESSIKNQQIIIDCPNLSSMKGIFAASLADFTFRNVGGSNLDLSYAFTFRDYNPSDIGGILNRISNGYAMYAKWDNSSDSIPSGLPEIPNSEGMWYGWAGNTDSLPVKNAYYYYSSIIGNRNNGTFNDASV